MITTLTVDAERYWKLRALMGDVEAKARVVEQHQRELAAIVARRTELLSHVFGDAAQAIQRLEWNDDTLTLTMQSPDPPETQA